MKKWEIDEAAAIIVVAIDMLLATSNDQQGRAGSDLRRACGDMKANVKTYIAENEIAAKVANCFEQARLTGATVDDFNRIRIAVDDGAAISLIAVLLQQACICYSLQQMALVIEAMTFTSRDDVDAMRDLVNVAFNEAEEYAADGMALTVYRALITLHAALVFYLYQTARPLPRMLGFEFAAIRPTLVQSYRLYDTASRADELRAENKIIHPAFAPRSGRALAPLLT
jgi:prophage DNA circulation protein